MPLALVVYITLLRTGIGYSWGGWECGRWYGVLWPWWPVRRSSFITLFRRLSVGGAYRGRFILIHHGSAKRRCYLTIHLLRCHSTPREKESSLPVLAVGDHDFCYVRLKYKQPNYELWICKCLMDSGSEMSNSYFIKMFCCLML